MRTFRLSALALVAMILFGVTSAFAAPAQKPNRTLAKIFADYETLQKARDPISAGFEGDKEALKRLPDASRKAELAHALALAALEARLKAVSPARLGAEDALNRDILSRQIADSLGAIERDEGRLAFTNDSGFHSLLDYLADVTPVRSVADAESWIARLNGAELFFADNIVNLRRGLETGWIQPRVVVEAALPAVKSQAGADPAKSRLLKPIQSLPNSVPEAERARLLAAAQDAIRTKTLPAQKAFATFLETEYLPKARVSLAVRDLPDGEAFYRAQVRLHTTTALGPEEIHALGQSEVARIRAEMERTIAQTGFKGSFQAFQTYLRTDPRFYAKTPQELLEKASEIAKRADDQMPRFFGTLPRLPYGVRPVPAEIAESYTTGRYFPGSPKLGQAGGYLVNTSKLDQRALYELPALTLHEGVPGHHHQIALAQERDDLPLFRREAGFTAFVEGWGLYSEKLGVEMGMYRDPYEHFGRLSYEMWRACRLVADTGIHWKRWSAAEARKCFEDNSALSPHNIRTEVERYISWPGQALAYKIGELKLWELRARAQARLKDRFDIRRFHDAVLRDGAVPIDLLEARIERWIETELTRKP